MSFSISVTLFYGKFVLAKDDSAPFQVRRPNYLGPSGIDEHRLLLTSHPGKKRRLCHYRQEVFGAGLLLVGGTFCAACQSGSRLDQGNSQRSAPFPPSRVTISGGSPFCREASGVGLASSECGWCEGPGQNVEC